MDDEKFAETVARDLVECEGSDVVPVIRELAEAAIAVEDELTAETWRNIADAAERLLQKEVA
jgi:uncharacterized alpha-E superfamily protein